MLNLIYIEFTIIHNSVGVYSKREKSFFVLIIFFKFEFFKGTLYMRRRTQLMREKGSKNKEDDEITIIRRNYLHLRTQILEQKYGPLDSSLSNSSKRTSKANSKAPSIDSQSLNLDWRDSQSNTKRMYSYVNSNVATALAPPNKYSSIYSSKESLNSVNNTSGQMGGASSASTSKSKLNTCNSSTNIDEQYSFAGVHHIFDNHRGAGKIICH
jgi:hypothetical protein